MTFAENWRFDQSRGCHPIKDYVTTNYNTYQTAINTSNLNSNLTATITDDVLTNIVDDDRTEMGISEVINNDPACQVIQQHHFIVPHTICDYSTMLYAIFLFFQHMLLCSNATLEISYFSQLCWI